MSAITQWVEGTRIEPGNIYQGLPNALYHAGPGISKSGLDDINTSPLYYKTRRANPQPPTPALMLGTAIHAAILEPEEFEKTYVCDPYPGSQKKEAKEAREELRAAGFVVLRHDPNPETIWGRSDWDTVRYVRDSVLSHPDASILLDRASGINELSHYWVDPTYGRLCKCRHDFWNEAHGLIIDLKTAIDATLSGFQRATHNYRYDIANAWYLDGTRLCGVTVSNMIFVVVEKTPPYHVGCYEIDPNWVREARLKYQRDLDVYSRCMRDDDWPSIPDSVRVLPMPGYAKFNPVS